MSKITPPASSLIASLGRKGDSWNESVVAPDPVTGRPVRRLTAAGLNEKPTYHTNTAFTADGEYLVFVSGRDGQSAVMKAHLASGELTQLTDPVPGLGGRWELHKCGPSRFCDGQGINGTTLCVAPRSRQALFFHGRALRAVHLDTLAERTLLADIGEGWIEGVISIDPAETHALVALMPAHPHAAAGANSNLDDYFSCFAATGMNTRYLQVPLDGGPAEVVFEDRGCGCAHCPHCPTDGSLVLIDRDLPPKFWCGDDGKTNRCWILNLATKALTPIVPRNAQRFQVHACWTFDGLHVFYHGWRAEGGWYVGVADRQGQIVREYDFPDVVGYGHVSADARRQAIILDGNVTVDMLTWLYWDAETPRLEPICRHATEWDSLSGQLHDPHPAADPTGRWIAFNVARGGRSDVYAVEVS